MSKETPKQRDRRRMTLEDARAKARRGLWAWIYLSRRGPWFEIETTISPPAPRQDEPYWHVINPDAIDQSDPGPVAKWPAPAALPLGQLAPIMADIPKKTAPAPAVESPAEEEPNQADDIDPAEVPAEAWRNARPIGSAASAEAIRADRAQARKPDRQTKRFHVFDWPARTGDRRLLGAVQATNKAQAYSKAHEAWPEVWASAIHIEAAHEDEEETCPASPDPDSSLSTSEAAIPRGHTPESESQEETPEADPAETRGYIATWTQNNHGKQYCRLDIKAPDPWKAWEKARQETTSRTLTITPADPNENPRELRAGKGKRSEETPDREIAKKIGADRQSPIEYRDSRR